MQKSAKSNGPISRIVRKRHYFWALNGGQDIFLFTMTHLRVHGIIPLSIKSKKSNGPTKRKVHQRVFWANLDPKWALGVQKFLKI